MRINAVFLFLLCIASCGATGKERSYTGSTPAAPVIRSFLGIPLSDSVDFIRWQLFIEDDQYHLCANYGTGKPNTNGFNDGGVKIELSGTLQKDKNYYYLQNGKETLRIVELNGDLLHLLNADNSLLVGNGGWSYTLNNIAPSVTDHINIAASSTALKDSMVYEGRTPCNVPGVVRAGNECYKLKWYMVLYANVQRNEPAGYKILGTRWRKEGGITGSWKIIKDKKDRIIYQLKVDKENIILHLLKLDENILVFTDADGKLLTGNEDFSYTMNRRW